MDLGYNLENQVLWQSFHLRPVLNIWSKLQFYAWICLTLTIKYAALIDSLVEEILWFCKIAIHICCRCQVALVCCCCCNRSSIHKCNRCNLSTLYLRSFSIREVTCRVTNRESVIGRCISRAEARSTESSLKYRTCFHNICSTSITKQFHIYRHTCRIHA